MVVKFYRKHKCIYYDVVYIIIYFIRVYLIENRKKTAVNLDLFAACYRCLY